MSCIRRTNLSNTFYIHLHFKDSLLNMILTWHQADIRREAYYFILLSKQQTLSGLIWIPVADCELLTVSRNSIYSEKLMMVIQKKDARKEQPFDIWILTYLEWNGIFYFYLFFSLNSGSYIPNAPIALLSNQNLQLFLFSVL